MSSKKGSKRLALLNGPNLNLLGERDKSVYGSETLADIEKRLRENASARGCELQCFQSNSEGELIDQIQKLRDTVDGLIINPAAFSHTSIALRDALDCFKKPIIEVHISNIHRREEFRHHSYVSAVSTGVICGLGTAGYDYALEALLKLVEHSLPCLFP